MEAPVVRSDYSEESEMALLFVTSSPPTASVGLNWGHGGCDLHLLSSVDGGPDFPGGDRRQRSPLLSCRVELHVARFYEDGRLYEDSRLCPCLSFSTPLRVSEAKHLTTPQGAAEATSDVMRLLGRNGPPIEALGRVAVTLRQYIQDVAAWALLVAPLLTKVHGAIYLWMTSEGEGIHHHVEEDGDDGEEEITAEQAGEDQVMGDSSGEVTVEM